MAEILTPTQIVEALRYESNYWMRLVCHSHEALRADLGDLNALLDDYQARALAAEATISAWQPIETLPAPINDAANQRVHIYMPDVIGDKIQVMAISNVNRLGVRITHWMPLPDPPQESR